MQVSFSGLKNIGYKVDVYQNEEDEDAFEASECKDRSLFLNLQLTDDFNGKDLTEFSNVLKKSGIPVSKYMCNEVNKDFLNIEINAGEYYDDLTNSISTDYEFYLNDVELKLKDKNLSVFDYLAKLTKRITSTPDDKFVINKDYLKSDDAAMGIELGEDLRDYCEESEYYNLVNMIHSSENVKNGSKSVNDIIQDMMKKYFKC